MVCVTQQKSCERLIARGSELGEKLNCSLHVIHVVKEGWKYFGKLKEADALEFLFEKSKLYGADLTVIKAKDIVHTLSTFVEKNNVGVVVMGESHEESAQQNMIKRFKSELNRQILIDIVGIDDDKDVKAV